MWEAYRSVLCKWLTKADAVLASCPNPPYWANVPFPSCSGCWLPVAHRSFPSIGNCPGLVGATMPRLMYSHLGSPQPLTDWWRRKEGWPLASSENSSVMCFMLQSQPAISKAKVRTCLRSCPCLAISPSLFCFTQSLIGFSSEALLLSTMYTQIPVSGFGSREPNLREPRYKSANLCRDSTPRSHLLPVLAGLYFLLNATLGPCPSCLQVFSWVYPLHVSTACLKTGSCLIPLSSMILINPFLSLPINFHAPLSGHETSCQLPWVNSWSGLIVTRLYYSIHECLVNTLWLISCNRDLK